MKPTLRFPFNFTQLALALMLALLMLIGLLLAGQVVAQESNDLWNEPANLSLSASASEPVIVVDSSGRPHAVWQDSELGFMYATNSDGTWTVARPVEFPFGTRRFYPDLPVRAGVPLYDPVLWSGNDDRIHALWVDDDQAMFYSNVPSTSAGDFEAWSDRQLFAPSGLSAAAVTDSEGRMHVAFVRPTEDASLPAGVYYRRSDDGGSTWSSPHRLYQSTFFRSLGLELVNLNIATTGNNEVIVAWDDPFQERVYVAGSDNGGQSWAPPVEVDRRLVTDGQDAIGPNGIKVASTGDAVHLVWQAGHEGLDCAVFHQVSTDGGASWQAPERIMERVIECTESNLLVPVNDELLLLLSTVDEGGYISAWNGLQWGEVWDQPAIKVFLNPLNFRQVHLGCQQPATTAIGGRSEAGALILVGCSAQENGDIWALTASLSPLIREIAPQSTPAWQRPDVVGETARPGSLQLLADADGWLHSFWIQTVAGDEAENALHYSRWDGTGWSQPTSLLTSPDSGLVTHPNVTLSADGKIMAVWSDGLPGSIYFSQVDAAGAGNASEWSSPIMLSPAEAAGSSPEIVVDQEGTIHVTYALPLNEGRGVYLTQSVDGGDSWLDPVQVFDGADSGWSMVDAPHLTVDGKGNLHLIWTRYSSPPGASPEGIYYARSTDNGASWAEVEEVELSPVVWGDVLSTGQLAVHRIWQEQTGDLWHQSSSDGGVSWAQPLRVAGPVSNSAVTTTVIDGAGRPWLLQAARPRSENDGQGQPIELRNWILTDGRWQAEENLRPVTADINGLSAAVTGSGALNVVFSALITELGADQGTNVIYHSNRQLELPAMAPTPLPTLTPTPLAPATPTPTPAPMPTATTAFPTEPDQGNGLSLPIDTSNPLTGPLVGIVPAAIIVLIAFFIAVRLVRRDRR